MILYYTYLLQRVAIMLATGGVVWWGVGCGGVVGWCGGVVPSKVWWVGWRWRGVRWGGAGWGGVERGWGGIGVVVRQEAEPSTTYPGWPCDEAEAPGVRSQHRVVLRVVCANLLARFVHRHPAITIDRPQIGFRI